MKRMTEEEFREWQFDDDFIEFLHDRQEKRQRPRVVGRYYPSSLYRCIRQIVLEWNAGMMPNDDTLRHFFAGDVYQEHIIDVVMKWKYGSDITKIEKAVSISIPVDPRKPDSDLIMLSGRIDELTMLYIDGMVVAVPNEAKTQKGGVKKYRLTPNPDHVKQLMCYLSAIGAPYGKLIYMDRSTLFTRTFHIDYDASILKNIFQRTRYIHKWVTVDKDKVPPPEAMQSSETKWRCRKGYCPVRDLCYKIEGFINDEPDD